MHAVDLYVLGDRHRGMSDISFKWKWNAENENACTHARTVMSVVTKNYNFGLPSNHPPFAFGFESIVGIYGFTSKISVPSIASSPLTLNFFSSRLISSTTEYPIGVGL